MNSTSLYCSRLVLVKYSRNKVCTRLHTIGKATHGSFVALSRFHSKRQTLVRLKHITTAVRSIYTSSSGTAVVTAAAPFWLLSCRRCKQSLSIEPKIRLAKVWMPFSASSMKATQDTQTLEWPGHEAECHRSGLFVILRKANIGYFHKCHSEGQVSLWRAASRDDASMRCFLQRGEPFRSAPPRHC